MGYSKFLPRAALLAGTSLLMVACATPTSNGPETNGPEIDVASDSEAAGLAMTKPLGEAGSFAVFEPAPSGRSTSLDYDVISDALEVIVFNTGPSTRIRARPKEPGAGTRFVRGHNSPYRLEGNKIFLSQFDDETGNSFREYVESLEAIGNSLDITTLPRNEQLAYWFNLHNVLVIATLAEKYPVRYPEDMRVGPNRERFHEAKLLNIKGVDLSLSDIREQIVYRYWDDPRVIYGFFHGDLGSPNINDEAFRSDNVKRLLDRNAKEFVNALRGVSRGSGTIFVSRHYFDAQAGLFPNWPTDLRRHLEKFAQEDVAQVLADLDSFRPMKYPNRTADMVGGDPRADIRAGAGGSPTPIALVEMVSEVREKYLELRRQGRIGGARVIIIDQPDGPTAEPESDTIE